MLTTGKDFVKTDRLKYTLNLFFIQVPASQGTVVRHGAYSDPIGPPGPGYSQSESSPIYGGVPEEIPLVRGISHICSLLAGWKKENNATHH